LTVSVIGCVVNGPGEARETDIGFTGGGNGTHQVYISGLTDHRLKDTDIVDRLVELSRKRPLRSKPRSKVKPSSQQRSNRTVRGWRKSGNYRFPQSLEQKFPISRGPGFVFDAR
jgi:(E)-4-hydroxy-3-methylbut-2-enyl-diphosphate synthase